MSINISDEDVLDKMAEIEGEYWKELQKEVTNDPCFFYAFLKIWTEQYSNNKSLMVEASRLNYFMSVGSNGAIYGHNGYNRYAVRADGNIFFMRDVAIQSDVQKAIELGFDIM